VTGSVANAMEGKTGFPLWGASVSERQISYRVIELLGYRVIELWVKEGVTGSVANAMEGKTGFPLWGASEVSDRGGVAEWTKAVAC
ncbi:MAG: hypothetical protein ACK4NT_05550, partial [Candidatus Omnitrophota bacterium]